MTGGGGLQPCVLPSVVSPGEGKQTGGSSQVLKECLDMLKEGKDKEAKMWVREWEVGVDSLDRPELWTAWSGVQAQKRGVQVDNNEMYWFTVDTCFGSRDLPSTGVQYPSCVDASHSTSYHLDSPGQVSLGRVLTCLAYNCPDVAYCPLLCPTAAILRHYLSEEQCYAMLEIILNAKSNVTYLSHSKKSWEVTCAALKPLAQKHTAKCITFLEGELGQEKVDSFLYGWPWWIFEGIPFSHIVRVFDCFLLEGNKVLYRVALALLKTFHKQHGKSGKELKKNGIGKEFMEFCKGLKLSPQELLTIAFKFPRFSKGDIKKACTKLEMEAKSTSIGITKSRSNEGLPTPQSIQDIKAVSDTLTYKQGQRTPQPKQSGMLPALIQAKLKSEILSPEQLMTIWHMIPVRYTMISPKLAYSTNEHGTSLTSFYNLAGGYEPSVLVIRTTNGHIFGAFCSTSWRERNCMSDSGIRQTYFGTGETFLFSLAGGVEKQWPWVGLDKEEDEEAAPEMFLSGDNTMFTIGGGGGTGIYIDENLRFGRTEKCATFNNEPLCGETDFTVSVLEVYGFTQLDCAKGW